MQLQRGKEGNTQCKGKKDYDTLLHKKKRGQNPMYIY